MPRVSVVLWSGLIAPWSLLVVFALPTPCFAEPSVALDVSGTVAVPENLTQEALEAKLEEERLLAEQRQFIYPLADQRVDIVGWLRTVEVTDAQDTLVDIGRRYKYGFDAIKAANPGVDPWLPEVGAVVTLPGEYVLPDAPRRGIVINVSEKRLYYYPVAAPGEEATVEIYAVSVGRGDWRTPLRTTRVTGMVKHPAWFPPASVRAEHAARGDELPTYVPPGPDNPLGDYVIRLAIPSYFIHGTNRENGVGMQVTHGCIRMYPVDIDRLANSVPKRTPVHIVNQRYKVGWQDGVLFLEAHPPLRGADDKEDLGSRSLTRALSVIRQASPELVIDWPEVWAVQRAQRGIPMRIGQLAESGEQEQELTLVD